jgi:hypothetical protein
LIDRQYELTLKFEFASTGLPLSETRLTIPVWIFADEYYGIPSESRTGVPIKQMQRFMVPKDADAEGPGSLPGYEDTYLSNMSGAPSRDAVIVGDGGTSAAPFSLNGREPDYFARTRRSRAAQGATGSSSRTIEGIEPPEGEDEEGRVPAWQIKELEGPDNQQQQQNHDGAQ